MHERDILVPLSRQQAVEFDEVLLSLAYAAALGPGLRAADGSTSAGSLGVIGHDPTIEGNAVQLLEALSLRAPRLPIAEKHRWLLAGLDEAFDAGTYLDADPPASS